MTDLDKFKARVTQFIERTKISRRLMGKRACNDSSFVYALEDGREPKFSTIAKVSEWMDLYDIDQDKALGKSGAVPSGGDVRSNAA